MTKFQNKSFNVGMYANSNEPKCRCGKTAKVGTQEGYFCDDCYINRKKEVVHETIDEYYRRKNVNFRALGDLGKW